MIVLVVLIGLVAGAVGIFGLAVAVRDNLGLYALYALFAVLLAIVLVVVLRDKEMDHARLTLYRAAAGYEVSDKDRRNAVERLAGAKDFEFFTLRDQLRPTPEPTLNQPWRK